MSTWIGAAASPADESDANGMAGLLRRLLDRLPAMVAYWDAEQRNVYANDAYVEWFGWRPAEMVGVHINEVLGAELYEKNRPFIDGALRGEEQLFERSLADAHGRVRHTQASYIPDIHRGLTVGFFVLVTDITARVEADRAAREAVDMWRALANQLPGSFVMLFDRDLRYTLADGPALTAFGHSSATIEGRTLSEALPDRAEALDPIYRAALEGTTTSWEREVAGRTYVLTASPVTGATSLPMAGLVFGTDITLERRRARTDAALRRIATAAADGAPSTQILALVSETLLDLFDASFTGVARLDQGSLDVLAVVPALAAPMVAFMPTSAASLVAANGTAHLVHHVPTQPTGTALARGFVTTAAAPIRVNGATWGVIEVGLIGADETENLLDELSEFAELAGVSISSAAAWEKLAREATIDPLTNLPNRRAFDTYVERALQAAARERHPFSLALIDLDHFKTINDTNGHATGDTVLETAARRMSTVTRGGDMLARIGGDEFALVLQSTDTAEATAASERLRLALIDAGDTITASIGVATSPDGSASLPELLAAADQALYDSKHAGRNALRSRVLHRHPGCSVPDR